MYQPQSQEYLQGGSVDPEMFSRKLEVNAGLDEVLENHPLALEYDRITRAPETMSQLAQPSEPTEAPTTPQTGELDRRQIEQLLDEAYGREDIYKDFYDRAA